MMIFTNPGAAGARHLAGISDHQRQRGRALDRRLHRVLRRPARAQGDHHLCRGDLAAGEIQGRLPHGARRRASRSSRSSSASRKAGAAPPWRIPARSRAAVEAFDAVAGEVGVIRADTLDDAVEITELLVHTGAPPGRRLGAVTLSGAYRGLLLDAAERNGLEFHALAPATTERLNAVLTVGSLVVQSDRRRLRRAEQRRQFHGQRSTRCRPTRTWTWCWCRRRCRARPAPIAPSTTFALADDYAATKATKPIAFVTPISHGQTDYSRALRAKARHVSFLQEAYKALRAIASVARRDERARLAHGTPLAAQRAHAGTPRADRAFARARATAKPVALDEAESKEVLRAYGIATPAEALVTSRAAAIEAAGRIGYPVVLKAVSADAHAQVGRRARWRSISPAPSNWRRPMTAWRSVCSSTTSPACWSAGRSAVAWSSCSAFTAIPKWAWW